MNTFKEMLLIPLEEYKSYRKQLMFNDGGSGSYYPMQKALLGLAGESPMQKELINLTGFSPMQKELYNIKDKYGNLLPEDQRLKLEAEVIAKHTGFNKKAVEGTQIKEDVEKRAWIKQSLDDFAKTHKNRAKQLFNQMDKVFSSDPRWNNKGELLNESGETISGSNILDHINYVTAQRTGQYEPMGFD